MPDSKSVPPSTADPVGPEYLGARGRWVVWLGLVAAFFLVLWQLGGVLFPFVTAVVLAYVLAPISQFCHRHIRFRRHLLPYWASALIVEGLFIICVVALFLLLLPVVLHLVPRMQSQIPQLLLGLADGLERALHAFDLGMAVPDLQALRQVAQAQMMAALRNNWDGILGGVVQTVHSSGSWALAVVGNSVLTLLALFFMLLEWERFLHLAQSLIPYRLRPAVLGFLQETDQVLGQYFRGQVLVMLVLAMYYAATLALAGLDMAFPVGIFTGLAVFVPYLGFGMGLVLALISALLQFHDPVYAVALIAIIYGIGQMIESFALTPYLVGKRVGLHPLALIFLLLLFGQLFGFIGVLLALPLSAILAVALRRLKERYMASHFYKG